jgi:gas vesicle protein
MAREATAREQMREELRRELREELESELREELRAEQHAAKGARAGHGERHPGAGPDGSGADGHAQGDGTPLGAAQALSVGALGAAALMLLADNREKLRPLVVGTMKEFFRFKDWLGTNVTGLRDDLSDMSAEARAEYEQELSRHLAALDKERELVQRLQDLSKRRSGEGH